MRRRNKLIYGVGVNDFDFPTSINGKPTYEYGLWKDMIRRCYDVKLKAKYPTYENCTMDNELLSFSNFYNIITNMKGFRYLDDKNLTFCLDKDLLGSGDKMYKASNICFLPPEINSFLTKKEAARGLYPLGVTKPKISSKFVASINTSGRKVSLGRFDTKEDAFEAYRKAKQNHAKKLALKWKDCIDERAFNKLIGYDVSILD